MSAEIDVDPRDAVLARALQMQPGEGLWCDFDEGVYHGLDVVSRSRLEVLRSSPALYFARYLAAEPLPDEDTPALRHGRWLHAATLEPDRWTRTWCRQPEPLAKPDLSHLGAPSSKAYRAGLAAWRAKCDEHLERELAGRIGLPADEHELVLAMAAAIAEHPGASQLVSGARGVSERTAFWRDAETGVLMRGRLDRVLEGDLVVDVKTTSTPDPDGFGKACGRYGYHRQAACYLDAALAITGRPHRFRFVVVHNAPPFEVAVYGLDDYAVERGREQYRSALAELARRERDNDWLAEWQRHPQELHLPAWALM